MAGLQLPSAKIIINNPKENEGISYLKLIFVMNQMGL
jgi:hypothetical protein